MIKLFPYESFPSAELPVETLLNRVATSFEECIDLPEFLLLAEYTSKLTVTTYF